MGGAFPQTQVDPATVGLSWASSVLPTPTCSCDPCAQPPVPMALDLLPVLLGFPWFLLTLSPPCPVQAPRALLPGALATPASSDGFGGLGAAHQGPGQV